MAAKAGRSVLKLRTRQKVSIQEAKEATATKFYA